MLKSQIAQQARSSYTPSSRLTSKHKPNPKEHCNCIVLRSDKQLEDTKDDRVEVGCENSHYVSDNALHGED